LIRKELESIVDEFGDARRTVIREQAPEASAFSATELVPNEPVTIVLSQKGWIRSAKGHEIDPPTLSYREGDEFLCGIRAKTNDQCVLFDSTGRMYSMPILNLPSARGQGEPLTSILAPPPNSRFVGAACSADAQLVVASSLGKGFALAMPRSSIKVKAGKTVVVLQEGSELLPPSTLPDNGRIVLVSDRGRLLVVDSEAVPFRSRGTGVSLIGLSTRGQSESDRLTHVLGIGQNDSVEVVSGKRTMTLSPKKLLDYVGRRANRGRMLPRGYTNVSSLRIA
jgi:topoisomerase-4 subunit A